MKAGALAVRRQASSGDELPFIFANQWAFGASVASGLLGFSLSMAVNHFDTRRDLVLKEANAVGTTRLRAGLLPTPHRIPVKELLRRSVVVRLKYEPLVSNPAMPADPSAA